MKFIKRYIESEAVSSFHPLAASSSGANYGAPSLKTCLSLFRSFIAPSTEGARAFSSENVKIFIDAFDSGGDITYTQYRKAFEDIARVNRHQATLFIYHTLPNLTDSAAIIDLVQYVANYSWYPLLTRTFRAGESIKGPSLLETIFLSQDNESIKFLLATAQTLGENDPNFIRDAISSSISISPLIAKMTFDGLAPDLKAQLADYYKTLDYLSSAISPTEIFQLVSSGDVTGMDIILRTHPMSGILKIKTSSGATLLQLAEDNNTMYNYLISKMTYEEFKFVGLLNSGMNEDAQRSFEALAQNNIKALQDFFLLAAQLDNSELIVNILEKLAHIAERDDIIEFLVDHDCIDTIKFLSESETTAERVKIKLDGDAQDTFLIKYQELHREDPEKLELMKKFIELSADPLAGGNDSAIGVAAQSGNSASVKCYLDIMSKSSGLDHFQTALAFLYDKEYFPSLLKIVATYSSKLEQLQALQKAINEEVNGLNKEIVKIITKAYANSEDDFAVFKALLDNAATDAGDIPELLGISDSIVAYLNDQKIFDINKPANNSDKASLVGHYASTGTPEALEILHKLLIQNNINLEITDKNGHTPLMAALENKCRAEFKLLLSAGADKTAQNIGGGGLLHVAMEADNPEMLEEVTMMLARDRSAKHSCSMKDAIKMVTEEIALNGSTPLHSGLMQGSYSSITTLLLKHNVILNDELFEMANLLRTGCMVEPISSYPKILNFVFAYSIAFLQNNMAQFKRGFMAAQNEGAQTGYVDEYLSKLISRPGGAAKSGEAVGEDEDDGDASCASVPAPLATLEDLKSAFINYLESLRETHDTIIMLEIYRFIYPKLPALDKLAAEKQLAKHVAYSEEIANLHLVYSKALSSEALQDPEDIHTACGSGGEASSHKEVKVSIAQTDPADFQFARAINLDLAVDVAGGMVDIAPEILGAGSQGGDFDD